VVEEQRETQDAVVEEQRLRILWWSSRDSGCCGGGAETQDAVAREQRIMTLLRGRGAQDAVDEEQRLRMLYILTKFGNRFNNPLKRPQSIGFDPENCIQKIKDIKINIKIYINI
jgi:hypothetical protein